MSNLIGDINNIKRLEQIKENIEAELEELKIIDNPLTKENYCHVGFREGLSVAWTLVNLTLGNANNEELEE